MKRTNVVALSIGLATLATAAFAKPQYLGILKSTYKLKGKPASAATCATCHAGAPPALNPYGKAVAAMQKKMKAKSVTPAILKMVSNLDSDKDGVKNGAEIKAGTNPGNKASK